MSGAAHTPGPWIARPWRNHAPTTVVREVNGKVQVVIADVEPAGSSRYLMDPETIANANLIAAAPDLLALARQYASECDECNGTGLVDPRTAIPGRGGNCGDCAAIRAVIAKATEAAR